MKKFVPIIVAGLMLTACTANGGENGPAWPTNEQIKSAAPDGRELTKDEYRWAAFTACGAYTTFGAFHYVVPEAIADSAGHPTAVMAGFAKATDEQSGRNPRAGDMQKSVIGPMEWPGDLAEWSESDKLVLFNRVSMTECPDLVSDVQGRLFDGTGVR